MLEQAQAQALGADRGRLGNRVDAAALGDRDLVELVPLAVVLELHEEVVDEVDGVGVVVLHADAQELLGAKRVAGDAVLARVLDDVAHLHSVLSTT